MNKKLVSNAKNTNPLPNLVVVTKPLVEIYTDGACSGNPGPGGWGALLKFKDVSKEIKGYSLLATNNQMEILAAIEALNMLKKQCTINLYTDSVYLQKGITEWIKNWQINNWCNKSGEAIKNVDLWKRLLAVSCNHDIIWHWVKGHSDNEGNNIADRLACEAKDEAIKISSKE